jgi:hypothetical protein
MLELPSHLGIRTHRLEASYTAARLGGLDATRELASGFEEAADKFRLLEEEEARLEMREVDLQASVESADDAWDDVIVGFRRRLLDLAGNDVDAEIYRRYFADIPSAVTGLSYAAEIMISRDLERALTRDALGELVDHAGRLEEKRLALEAALHERTRLEVDVARFRNRVALAKSILNKLRRVLFAQLEEIAVERGLGRDWCARFFLHHEMILEAMEIDAVDAPLELPPETGGQRALTDGAGDP